MLGKSANIMKEKVSYLKLLTSSSLVHCKSEIQMFFFLLFDGFGFDLVLIGILK